MREGAYEPWARAACDEVFALPSLFDRRTVVNAITYLARTREIDRIAPLDDYDVEMAAALASMHPRHGESTARYFRDSSRCGALLGLRRYPSPETVRCSTTTASTGFLGRVPRHISS
ncbi:MAG: hypothetical protein U0166_13920 [Acidobacteriota bacterium]